MDGIGGAQLVEIDLRKQAPLIDRVVHQAEETGFDIEPPIFVFGKERRQPRDVQFRSNESKGYFYSNRVMKPQPLTSDMKALMDVVNRIFGSKYNGILINRYRDGTKKIGAHDDGEVGLNVTAGVVTISHGVERKFRIKEKKNKNSTVDYPTRHHFAMQMKGPFQEHYTHEIPAEKKITEARVSLTFRQHDLEREELLFARKKRARGV